MKQNTNKAACYLHTVEMEAHATEADKLFCIFGFPLFGVLCYKFTPLAPVFFFFIFFSIDQSLGVGHRFVFQVT